MTFSLSPLVNLHIEAGTATVTRCINKTVLAIDLVTVLPLRNAYSRTSTQLLLLFLERNLVFIYVMKPHDNHPNRSLQRFCFENEKEQLLQIFLIWTLLCIININIFRVYIIDIVTTTKTLMHWLTPTEDPFFRKKEMLASGMRYPMITSGNVLLKASSQQ